MGEFVPSNPHYPGLALDGGGITMGKIIGFNADQLCSSPFRRERLIEMGELLCDRIIYLNAFARNIPLFEAGIADGVVPLMDTPALKDKYKLLAESVTASSRILEDDTLDDSAALRRAGLVISTPLIYIHPFADGNGRTSRLVQYLIEFGSERGERLFEAEILSNLAKTPVIPTPQDTRLSIHSEPHPIIKRSIEASLIKELGDDEFQNIPPRKRAAIIIERLIKVLSGDVSIETSEAVSIQQSSNGQISPIVEPVTTYSDSGRPLYPLIILRKVPKGSDLFDLIVDDYVARSFTPDVKPEIANEHLTDKN